MTEDGFLRIVPFPTKLLTAEIAEVIPAKCAEKRPREVALVDSRQLGLCNILFAMTRESAVDSRQEILRTAARLFQQHGYDATSMNDVAAALKLSKGGLYHHFQSKDEILFNLMSHAMDITQERVIDGVRGITGPEERLRALIRRHIEVVMSVRDREITVMLHENHPLPPAMRRRINARKKDYVHFVENLIAEVQRERPSSGTVSPRAAAFALLGMINWIYQWYRPDGSLSEETLVRQYTDIFFAGAFQ